MRVNGAAQLRLIYALGGQEGAINVIGAIVTGSVTFNQTLANTLGTAIKGAWTTNMAPLCSTGVSLARVGIRDLRTDNQPEFRDTGAVATGTGVGDILPRGTALCVTVRTAQSGKSFRGRVYLPGFTEGQNDVGGATASAANTSAVTFCQAVDNALKASGMAFGVISRPAERYQIVKTIFHNDGTTTVKTLSNVTAKTGLVTQATVFESRTARWEYQRRRDNSRTIPPTLLNGAVFSLPAAT